MSNESIIEGNQRLAAAIEERAQKKLAAYQPLTLPGRGEVYRFRRNILVIHACVLGASLALACAVLIKFTKPDGKTFATTTDGQVTEVVPLRIEQE